MTNLYIIGNGFDLAHGMKTKYSDFRNYLVNTYLLECKNNLDDCDIPYPDIFYQLLKQSSKY